MLSLHLAFVGWVAATEVVRSGDDPAASLVQVHWDAKVRQAGVAPELSSAVQLDVGEVSQSSEAGDRSSIVQLGDAVISDSEADRARIPVADMALPVAPYGRGKTIEVEACMPDTGGDEWCAKRHSAHCLVQLDGTRSATNSSQCFCQEGKISPDIHRCVLKAGSSCITHGILGLPCERGHDCLEVSGMPRACTKVPDQPGQKGPTGIEVFSSIDVDSSSSFRREPTLPHASGLSVLRPARQGGATVHFHPDKPTET